MKLSHICTAAAAVALMGGAASAQSMQQPADPATPPASEPAAAPAADPTPPLPADPAAPGASTTGAGSSLDVTAPAASAPATSATTYAQGASTFTNMTVTNGPVPDTAENRKKYGQPMSHAGKRSSASGN